MLVTASVAVGPLFPAMMLAAAESSPDSPMFWVNYGVLGAVAFVLFRVAVAADKRKDQRIAQLEAENAALRKAIDETHARAFEALTTALDELKRATDAAAVPPRRPPR